MRLCICLIMSQSSFEATINHDVVSGKYIGFSITGTDCGTLDAKTLPPAGTCNDNNFGSIPFSGTINIRRKS